MNKSEQVSSVGCHMSAVGGGGGGLDSEVQDIMGNGHIGTPPPMDRQNDIHD